MSEPGNPCRNCGRPAGPRYCGHCGQEVAERRGPLLSVLGELFSEWFSLDGALPRTVVALFRPGKLTREHVDGRRARYLRPLRLYAVASLALFSTTLDFPKIDADTLTIRIGSEVVHEAREGDVQRSLNLFSTDSRLLSVLADRQPERLRAVKEMPPQELVDRLFEGYRKLLPTVLVLFVPFLALALKLLHLRTGTLYVDHVVFAVHFQSALFLLLAVPWLMSAVFGLSAVVEILASGVAGALMLLVYLPLSLRRVFAQRGWWVALKTVVILFIYLRLLGLAVGGASALILWRAT